MNFSGIFTRKESSSSTSITTTTTIKENSLQSKELLNFVSIPLLNYKNTLKSSYERIKEIDQLYFHLPSLTERYNLRLPLIYEHINISNCYSFLILCGGNNGIQFTIQEMETVLKYLTLLKEHIVNLDTLYKTFSPKMIHQKLSARTIQQLKRNPQLEKSILDESQQKIYQLHLLADKTIDIFSLLQIFILGKYTQERDRQQQQQLELQLQYLRQSQQDSSNSSNDTFNNHSNNSQVAKDINLEGRKGDGEVIAPAREEWFEVLLEKYQTEYGVYQHEQHDSDMILSILQDKSIQHSLNVFNNINESSMTDINNETNYSNDSTFSLKTSSTLSIPKKILRKVRPQLNLFCVYYASCLLGEVDCTKKEWIALMKLVHLTGAITHPNATPPLYTHIQWSERFYDLLRDIKSFEFSSLEEVTPNDYCRVLASLK